MSDEKIYTNSQVEQVKNELNTRIDELQSKIKKIEFITKIIKVRDVRYSSDLTFSKIKIAYHIEGHSSKFAETVYAYPVIYDTGVGIEGNKNVFFVYAPVLPNGDKIVELTDDDTLKVQYMAEKTLE